ncbi:MAG: translation elongation factor Ts [Planctomycetota bacterium]|nr:MAG: translation elongation factor Ts [Planctomycetota bacterium]REJ97853.1 MAG: translation elongation factor Ts [Planctomycetota bacterium]
MANVTASAVGELRKKTGLPLMECKKALAASDGDVEAAMKHLREQGKKTAETRLGRDTDFGRIGIFADMEAGVGAMVEVQCESAPVAGSDDTIQFANDLAKQLATGPGAATPEELLAQPSPSQSGVTLAEQKDDLFNRIREVFNVSRLVRFDGPCGAYAHHAGRPLAALLEVEGGSPEAAKDVCMHIIASAASAVTKDDLDPELVAKEVELQKDLARKEGKPENIIEKMIDGRMKKFYEQSVLADQKFVKDEEKTVAQFADEHGMKLVRFVRWELGK